MNDKKKYDSPLVQLAVERKVISAKQYEQCKELVKKSKRIGLATTFKEVMVKQGFCTEE